MCSTLICGAVTVIAGVILVITSTIVGYVVVPNAVRNGILNEVVLLDDTIQMERFEEVPFPLNMTIRVFNISNAAEAMNGAVPVVTEVGPYVYKVYSTRVIENIEEDKIQYRKLDFFEFDPVASFPNTEDDILHISNVAYHGVLQIAEDRFPEIMTLLNEALPDVFGDNTEPIVPVRLGDVLFDGINLCENPGFLGIIACLLISQISTDLQNMQSQPDGSIKFSLLGYRNGLPSGLMEVYRGINNPEDLGRLTHWEGSPRLSNWPDSGSVCNMLNGTDSGVFNPFIDKEHPLFAFNSDICRSVKLQYQNEVEYHGITLTRFAITEFFLDNDDGCFCLNVTSGINREDGCMLHGAMELLSCVGAYMVLSNPHFLYADIRYRSGVVGMNPVVDDHRIYLDIEPNTGTVVRGAKRAQFNVFMRPVDSIPSTERLRTTLTPVVWFEEGIMLPEEFTDQLKDDLLSTLELLNIVVPVAVAVCCVVLLIGIGLTACSCLRRPATVKKTVLTNE